MKSVPHMFADITAALEDMHGIAVEGQSKDQSPDIHDALLMNLQQGMANLDRLLAGVSLLLLLDDHTS